jgi:hypothetical protein
VDVLDVHWYPEAQGGGVRITGDETGDAVADARMQAPRSLWDASYTETSWITGCCSDGAIRLIPRLQDKIDAHYPGTGIAITEYNYGAAGHISGGVAQADVLGIFGREGMFAAMWWQLSAERAFVDGAFEMFRDFDGSGLRASATRPSRRPRPTSRACPCMPAWTRPPRAAWWWWPSTAAVRRSRPASASRTRGSSAQRASSGSRRRRRPRPPMEP